MAGATRQTAELVEQILPNTHTTNIYIGQQINSGSTKVHNGPVITTTGDRNAILRWLSSLSFHWIHGQIQQLAFIPEQNKHSRHLRCGAWLLESELFKEWKARGFQKLWYIGMREYTYTSFDRHMSTRPCQERVMLLIGSYLPTVHLLILVHTYLYLFIY